MSFKRFETEDIVLSSDVITFPTWYTQENGDTSELHNEDWVPCDTQGASIDFYADFYSKYTYISASGEEVSGYDPSHSKALFSLAYAERPEKGYVETGSGVEIKNSEIIFGQYRSLVLGDEESEFKFGSTVHGVEGDGVAAKSFIAFSVERARFREKLDPNTCRFTFKSGESSASFSLAPDINANQRYLDAGRVYDLAEYVDNGSGSISYKYPESSSAAGSYGYFLPDIGLVLFNTDTGSLEKMTGIDPEVWNSSDEAGKRDLFIQSLSTASIRSQETVTSNYIFVRARNAEFNYSTNPSNITGSAGNIRWDTMINQPQAFVTTVGLYNDSNDLLAVAKLSRPIIKDFTKEILIRVKLDY